MKSALKTLKPRVRVSLSRGRPGWRRGRDCGSRSSGECRQPISLHHGPPPFRRVHDSENSPMSIHRSIRSSRRRRGPFRAPPLPSTLPPNPPSPRSAPSSNPASPDREPYRAISPRRARSSRSATGQSLPPPSLFSPPLFSSQRARCLRWDRIDGVNLPLPGICLAPFDPADDCRGGLETPARDGYSTFPIP